MAVDEHLAPLPDVFMYNDACLSDEILTKIGAHAPHWSPARGTSGGLGCVLTLMEQHPHRILHQSDWINYHLVGRWVGDASSALKSGFDPIALCWPDWLQSLGFKHEQLPEIFPVGQRFGLISQQAAQRFGLSNTVQIIAGTTDGCASFLATGASEIGDGVTVLGTTLTIKLLSDRAVFAPKAGIYSHKIKDQWLVGGASNSGGDALAKYFSASDLQSLSRQINPHSSTGLDYYPLPGKGERFPIEDPTMEPLEAPRPYDDATFLQGLLEGIAMIEKAAYAKLAKLGAPKAARIFTTGGGAKNSAWTDIRSRIMGISMATPVSTDAAYGSALLARAAIGA